MVETRSATRSKLREKEGIEVVTERLRKRCQRTFEPVGTKTKRNTPVSNRTHSKVSNSYAAILVPLFEDKDGIVRVWLNQRSNLVSTHKGEVCLPGGKRDKGDKDDYHTALREAHEELGLDPCTVQILGSIHPILSKHTLSVSPIIGVIPNDFEPIINKAEVSSVFSVPLKNFLNAKNHSHQDADWDGIQYRVHFFQEGPYLVWGLTASVLIQVAQLAFEQSAEFDVKGDGADYTDLYYDGNDIKIRSKQ